MSGYVVLRLPLSGAVVTGSRASFFETRILGPDESEARHNHSAMIDDPGIVMGIRDQGLPRELITELEALSLAIAEADPRWDR